jgi:hypothetical protein
VFIAETAELALVVFVPGNTLITKEQRSQIKQEMNAGVSARSTLERAESKECSEKNAL